jgi:hypothetical protein
MKSLSKIVNNALSSIRRWRWKKSAERYFDNPAEVVARDTMPVDVASDKLCEINVRMTNKERKMFSSARDRWLIPGSHTARKEPFGLKLLRRFESRPLTSLGKWYQRSAKRRRGLQKKYELLVTLESADSTKAKKVLDMRAAALELAMDVAETVINWRKGLATGTVNKPELVGVLKNPVTGKRMIWTENLDTGGVNVRRTEFPRWVPLKEK